MPLQPDPLEDAREVGADDDLFDDAIAAARVAVDGAIGRNVVAHPLGARVEVALLLVEEVLAVRDQELEIAQLGTIDGGVVDLGKDALPESEPDPAIGRVGGTDAFLGPVGPARLDTGSSECIALAAHAGHI